MLVARLSLGSHEGYNWGQLVDEFRTALFDFNLPEYDFKLNLALV